VKTILVPKLKSNIKARAKRLAESFLSKDFLYLKVELEANVQPNEYSRESECYICSGTGIIERQCSTCSGEGTLIEIDTDKAPRILKLKRCGVVCLGSHGPDCVIFQEKQSVDFS